MMLGLVAGAASRGSNTGRASREREEGPVYKAPADISFESVKSLSYSSSGASATREATLKKEISTLRGQLHGKDAHIRALSETTFRMASASPADAPADHARDAVAALAAAVEARQRELSAVGDALDAALTGDLHSRDGGAALELLDPACGELLTELAHLASADACRRFLGRDPEVAKREAHLLETALVAAREELARRQTELADVARARAMLETQAAEAQARCASYEREIRALRESAGPAGRAGGAGHGGDRAPSASPPALFHG